MISVSSAYNNIITGGGSYEWRITNGANTWTVANLISGTLTTSMFDELSVGNAPSAQLDLKLWDVTPDTSSPLVLQFRATDGASTQSAWYTKGTFFIDTVDTSPYSEETKIVAFDSMLKAEVTYMASGSWIPKTDFEVVTEIVGDIGVTIESETSNLLSGSPVTLSNAPNVGPNGVTDRQMLCYIAAIRGGNFIINPAGELQLILAYQTPQYSATIGDAVHTFDASPAEVVKRVKVIVDSETYYLAPVQSSEEEWEALGGRCLTVEIPFFGSQAIANSLFTSFSNKSYIPYDANGAFADPKYGVGDGLTIKDVTSVIATQVINIDPLASSEISFDCEEALNSLYPFVSPSMRNVYYETTKAQDAASAAQTAADAAQTSANGANYREQLIYISKASGTTSVSANTTWVTNSTGNQNVWTTKRPVYDSSYPVLFVATQRQTVAQKSGTTCTCTTPVIDQTTTVIDGGHITTGSIDAGYITTGTLKAIVIQDSNNPPKNSWDLSNGVFTTTQGFIGGLSIDENGISHGSVREGGAGIALDDLALTVASTYGSSSQQASLSGGNINFSLADASLGLNTYQLVGEITGSAVVSANNSFLGGAVDILTWSGSRLVPALHVAYDGTTVNGDLITDGNADISGTLTVNGIAEFNSNVRVGTETTAAERYVMARSNSGTIYLDSIGNANGNGNRGVYMNAHGTGSGGWLIYADTNNNVISSRGIIFNSKPTIRSGSSNTQIDFASASQDIGERTGIIYMSHAQTNSVYRPDAFYFRHLSYNSSTGATLTGSTYENFKLPSVTADRTSVGTYNIITTKNISDFPDASATVAGKVSTGAQDFTGRKTFRTAPMVETQASRYASYQLRTSICPTDEYYAILGLDVGSTTTPTQGRIYFSEASVSSTDGTKSGHYEHYWLPIPTQDRTADAQYAILTTKAMDLADSAVALNNLGAPNIGGYGTLLKAGDNVDTDLEMGKTYYSSSSSVSQSLEGTPPSTSSGFKIMQIRSYATSNFAYQIAFGAFGAPRIRSRSTASGSWTAWGAILDSRNAVTIAQGGTGQTAVTKGTSGVVTRSSGATLSGQSYSKWGKVLTLDLYLNISTTTAGSVCFTGTVASDYRPASNFYGGGGSFDWSITTAGALTISVAENGNISGGAGLYHTSVTYVIA